MRFRILGPVEVQVDGGWSSISATKWRTMLAVLLLRAGEVVSTEQLIGEVWPEDTPATAVNLISVYVLRLRRLIGDPEGQLLVTRSPGYQLLVTAGRRRRAAVCPAGRRGPRSHCRPGTSRGRPSCSARLSACGRGAGPWLTFPTLP